MSKFLRASLATCLAFIVFLTGAVSASSELILHEATYKIKISVLGGALKTSLDKSGEKFVARSSIQATGLTRLLARGSIREESEFTICGSRLIPNEYKSKDTLSSDEKFVTMKFDWDQNEILGIVNDTEFRVPIDGDVVDRMSLQYVLMHDLQNRNIRTEYIMQDYDERKVLVVTVLETKIVEVPFGRFEVIGIRHSTANSKRETTMWFAEELGYLPVVIEQYRKGELRGKLMLDDYVPQP